MKLRILVVVLLLVGMLPAATKVVSELNGRWKFLPAKSSGGQSFPPDTTLVVKQYGTHIFFEYWANDHVFRRDNYSTDGSSEKAYTTPNETAMVTGRIRKNELIITTSHIMENEIGAQSFSETDRWVLSDGGKVLTGKGSDGKTLVFEREGAATAPPPAAPAAKSPEKK